MADRSTIARPYARAAFDEARADKRLTQWSDAINIGAQVVQDARVQKLLDHPSVTSAELADFVIGVANGNLDQDGATPVRNFVQTLAENRRLGYLPEIAEIFNELKDAEEGIVDVTVTSAAPLDQQQQLTLSEALSRKLKRQVRLHCETDASLIGGAVLRAGDLVIDGSLRTRLDRIATELTA
jgi:F-type H+-transporting ATPase subunit delta